MESLIESSSQKYPWEGSGESEEKPFLIQTTQDILNLQDQVNNKRQSFKGKYFKQTANIDLQNKNWIPIGKESQKFLGNYNGNYFTISNLKIVNNDTLNTNYIGLFGYLGEYGTIKKIVLNNGIIENSRQETIIGSTAGVNYGIIEDCINVTKIKNAGNKCYVGGIVGLNKSVIKTCCNLETIDNVESNSTIGGITGYSDTKSSTEYSYNSGIITANNNDTNTVGGICGNSETDKIRRCFNIANLLVNTQNKNVGGVIGSLGNKQYSFNTCYYVDECIQKINNIGISKTRSEMCSQQFAELFDHNFMHGTDYSCGCHGSSTPYFSVLKQKEHLQGFMAKSLLLVSNVDGFIDGNGTEQNPFQIKTENQLKHINCHDSFNFKLMNDVSINIDNDYLIQNINGNIYGNGYSIKILDYPSTLKAVFSTISQRCSIKNIQLIVDLSKSTTYDYCIIDCNNGSLDGFVLQLLNTEKLEHQLPLCSVNNGTINNCHITNGKDDQCDSIICETNNAIISNCFNNNQIRGTKKKDSSLWVGGSGICRINKGTILKCYNTGKMKGYAICGVCQENYGKITDCYNTAMITSNESGGICEDNYDGGVIEYCYNSGTIIAQYIGGVCKNNDGEIKNCYNTGKIDGISNSANGGICRWNTAFISNCYNSGEIKGEFNGGICYYNGLMKGDPPGSKAVVRNCYNTGLIKGPRSTGICYHKHTGETYVENCYNASRTDKNNTGVFWENLGGKSISCYYNKDLCSKSVNEGNAYDIKGKTTSEMTNSSFAQLLDQGGAYIVKNHGDGIYYPELKVFAEHSNMQFKNDSKNSAKVR